MEIVKLTVFRNFHISSVYNKITPKNIKGKTVIEQKWIRRQLNDPYVQQSKIDYYRCRSAYKLIEIDDKYKILKPGYFIIDCGASPGSWCQVAVKRVNSDSSQSHLPSGVVIGIDLKGISPINGAHLLACSDFTDLNVQRNVIDLLQNKKVNVMLSDMSPNTTGIRTLDHESVMLLCKSVLRFSLNVLQIDGHLVVKIFQGKQQTLFFSALSQCFKHVNFVKPLACREDSNELYVMARNFIGLNNKIIK